MVWTYHAQGRMTCNEISVRLGMIHIVERYKGIRKVKETTDDVKYDMDKKGLIMKITAVRRQWKKNTCANTTKRGIRNFF